MLRLCDSNNCRALFERVLGSGAISSEGARPLWDKYGDLKSIQSVEKRRFEECGLETGGGEGVAVLLSR